jgi:hypothetical protein
MNKVLIGINTLTSVEQLAYSNHMQFFFRLGRNHTDTNFILCNPRRMAIDRMRNWCARLACEDTEVTHLMFIDDDVLVPFDAYSRLLACDTDIAAGSTLIRGYPFQNMFFKFTPEGNLRNYDDKDLKYNDKGLLEVDAVGFSCCLIKANLLRRIPSPWFVTGGYNTEDIYFCLKARQIDPATSIVVDNNLITKHILGPETIDRLNKQPFIDYMKITRPQEAMDIPEDKSKEKYSLIDPGNEDQIGIEELADMESGG